MKKQSLFSKSIRNKNPQTQEDGFPQTIKLTNEEIKTYIKDQQQIKQNQMNSDNQIQNSNESLASIQEKAKQFNISVEEYMKIDEQNRKTIGEYGEDKIKQMQEDIVGLLGEDLIKKFKSGEIYRQQKEQENEQKKETNPEKQLMGQIQDQMKQAVQFQIDQNPELFKDYLQDYPKIYQIEQMKFLNGITFKELQKREDNSLGTIIEFLESFKFILSEFHKEYKDNDGKYITRLDIIEYIESKFKLFETLLQWFKSPNFTIQNMVFDVLELYCKLLIKNVWSYCYDKTLEEHNHQFEISEIDLSLSNFIQNQQNENNKKLWNQTLDLLRFFKVLKQELGKQILMKAKSFLEQSPIVDFNLMMKINILDPSYSIQLKNWQFDFQDQSIQQLLFQLFKEFKTLDNPIQNNCIAQLSKLTKCKEVNSIAIRIIKRIFYAYNQLNCSNIQIEFEEQPIINQVRIQEFNLYINLLQNSINTNYTFLFDNLYMEICLGNYQLDILNMMIQNIKINYKTIINKKVKQRIKQQLIMTIRNIFQDQLVVMAKIGKDPNILKQLELASYLLKIVFYEKEQSEESGFELDKFWNGFLNFIKWKKLKNIESDSIEYFFYNYENQEGVNSEYLFFKFMNFIQNQMDNVQEESLVVFFKKLLDQIRFNSIGEKVNIKRSIFEKFFNKFTFDGFNRKILIQILFFFLHPSFNKDIHHLVLDEFLANKEIINQVDQEIYEKHIIKFKGLQNWKVSQLIEEQSIKNEMILMWANQG